MEWRTLNAKEQENRLSFDQTTQVQIFWKEDKRQVQAAEVRDMPSRQHLATSSSAEEVLAFWNKLTIDKVQATKAIQIKKAMKEVCRKHTVDFCWCGIGYFHLHFPFDHAFRASLGRQNQFC